MSKKEKEICKPCTADHFVKPKEYPFTKKVKKQQPKKNGESTTSKDT
jgi:hypothetical protein